MRGDRTSKAYLTTLQMITLALITVQAHAQVDQRARELLDGLRTEAPSDEFRTLDQTTVTTLYMGDEEVVSRTRTVLDMESDRVVVITESMGMITKMIHVDGETTMTVDGEPVPTTSLTDLMLQNALDEGSYIPMLAGSDDSATYDGEVSYGDVIAGVQVTYSGDYGVPGLAEMTGDVRFVFDEAGELQGQVLEMNGMTLIVVPQDEPLPSGTYDVDIYLLEGDAATLFTSTRYEEVRINEPVAESLFEQP